MTILEAENAQLGKAVPETQQIIGGGQANETLTPTIIEFNGEEYESNLPEGTTPLENSGLPFERSSLNFDAINELPVGDYWLKRTVQDTDDLGRPSNRTREEKREISILDGDKGPVVAKESLPGMWQLIDESAELMRLLGYELKGDKGAEEIVGIPTPDTVKNAVALLGIDIEFHSDQVYIPGSEYVKAYAEGKYPVSTRHYQHDIEDDHLTAMVLGGEPLREALMLAAQTALQKGGESADDAAINIDTFTAVLRSVVTTAAPLLGEAFGSESGRRTLMTAGEQLGLAPEITESILAQAQQTAATIGMDVQELK